MAYSGDQTVKYTACRTFATGTDKDKVVVMGYSDVFAVSGIGVIAESVYNFNVITSTCGGPK